MTPSWLSPCSVALEDFDHGHTKAGDRLTEKLFQWGFPPERVNGCLTALVYT